MSFAVLGACGGTIGSPLDGGPPSNEGGTDRAPKATCASLGGTCGSTPDLSCGAGEKSVAADCEDRAPCCVKIEPLAAGACRSPEDCADTSAIPGKESSSGTCTNGKCACGSGSVLLGNGRCGISPQDGERYLCTEKGAFPEKGAVCGVVPCDASAICYLSGMTAVCKPATRQRPNDEICALVNCGSLFCAKGLVCSDPDRGVCRRP